MLASLQRRFTVALAIVKRPLVKWPGLFIALVGAYDSLGHQLFSAKTAAKWPTVYELVSMTSGFMPLWGWALVLAGFLALASVEYAVRRTHIPAKNEGQSEFDRLARHFHNEKWAKAYAGVRDNNDDYTPSDHLPGPPQRDTWLQDALWFAIYGRWLAEDETALHDETELAKAGTIAEQMRARAYDGDFIIWGKRDVGRLHEIIPTEFWVDHEIDFLRLVQETAENVRTAMATPSARGLQFKGLMASKTQVESLWPAQNKFISLREAARLVLEATEGKPYGRAALRSNSIVERYRFLIAAIKVYQPLYGKSPPSNNVRLIDRNRMSQLWWLEDTDSLVELTTPKNIAFEGVCITERELRNHIKWALNLSEHDIQNGRY